MILNIGFVVALALAAGCLTLGAWYLYTFLRSTNGGIDQLIGNVANHVSDDVLYISINGRLVMARVALLSCGIFVGMAFGFLGFALFLIGAKGELNATAKLEGYSVKLARMSPGVFVLVCATVLIGICVSRSTPFSYQASQTSGDSRGDSKSPSPSTSLSVPQKKAASRPNIITYSLMDKNLRKPTSEELKKIEEALKAADPKAKIPNNFYRAPAPRDSSASSTTFTRLLGGSSSIKSSKSFEFGKPLEPIVVPTFPKPNFVRPNGPSQPKSLP